MPNPRIAAMLSLLVLAAAMSFLASVQPSGAEESPITGRSTLSHSNQICVTPLFREQRKADVYGRLCALAERLAFTPA